MLHDLWTLEEESGPESLLMALGLRCIVRAFSKETLDFDVLPEIKTLVKKPGFFESGCIFHDFEPKCTIVASAITTKRVV